MSARTTLRPQTVINAVAMTANITSAVTVLQSISDISYSFSWTGTSPVGTMSVQVSNDYAVSTNGTVSNAGTWTTIPILLSTGSTATSAPVTGNTGTGFFDITTGAYAIRTVYTFASGTGTLTATVAGKVS